MVQLKSFHQDVELTTGRREGEKSWLGYIRSLETVGKAFLVACTTRPPVFNYRHLPAEIHSRYEIRAARASTALTAAAFPVSRHRGERQLRRRIFP